MVPISANEHAVAPDSDEYEPIIHGVQVAPSKYSPGMHCLQYVERVGFSDVPFSSAQRRHAGMFVAFVNSPSPHSSHSAFVVGVHETFRNEPREHSSHIFWND